MLAPYGYSTVQNMTYIDQKFYKLSPRSYHCGDFLVFLDLSRMKIYRMKLNSSSTYVYFSFECSYVSTSTVQCCHFQLIGLKSIYTV
jgi:hypothetical protein